MKLRIKCLLAFLVLMSNFIPTFALNKGSITIRLEEAGIYTSVENVEFKLYKIADIKDGIYEFIDTYQELSIDLNSLETSKELDEASNLLASYISEIKLDELKVSKSNEQGVCTFEQLDVAVYLIVASDTTHYDDIKPTLIALPTFNETTKQMDYDVEVYPKHSPALITIELFKLDADDKTTPLKDAVFTLYDHEQNEIQTSVTNTDGIAAFTNVPFGDYLIKETSAPLGYKLSTDEINVTIDGNLKEEGVFRLQVFNEELPSYQTGDTEPVNVFLISSTLSFWAILVLYLKRNQNRAK